MGGYKGRVGWVRQGPAESLISGERVMADDNDKAPGVRVPPGRLSPKAGERPFDLWLHKQLHAMYDEIASEPLPDDLLKLIDKDAANGKHKSEPGDAPDSSSHGKKA